VRRECDWGRVRYERDKERRERERKIFGGGVDTITILSDSVLSKTAIFPEKREGNMHSSNESARVWLLRKTNV